MSKILCPLILLFLATSPGLGQTHQVEEIAME